MKSMQYKRMKTFKVFIFIAVPPVRVPEKGHLEGS